MTNIVLMTLILQTLPMIKFQESKGNPRPPDGKAGEVGVYQIRQCVVDDVNFFCKKSYKLEDCRNEETAKEIAIQYLYVWGTKKNLTTAKELARCFNGGPNGNKVKATITYWKQIAERNGLRV